MKRKCVLVLVLVAVASGTVFAQNDFDGMPKNTVTVDFGPTIIGAAIGMVGNMFDMGGATTTGFGIGFQYEHQILERVSVAGRFAYLGGGLGISTGEEGITASAGFKFDSFSIEGHIRFYPFAGTFFLDGMLGYANLSASLSGKLVVEKEGIKAAEEISFTASRNYFKVGGKLGWRVDFGKPSGFVFEPSWGFYGAFAGGDNILEQLISKVAGEADIGSEMTDMFDLFETLILVGGPRLCLSFGWRF